MKKMIEVFGKEDMDKFFEIIGKENDKDIPQEDAERLVSYARTLSMDKGVKFIAMADVYFQTFDQFAAGMTQGNKLASLLQSIKNA